MYFTLSTLLFTLLATGFAHAVPSSASTLAVRDIKPLPNPEPEVTCPVQPRKDREGTKGKYFKITMLVQKHANVTDEYFHKYWAKCSAPLAMDCGAFRENVVKYVSQHQTPALKVELGALGYPMANYDGITEVWVESLDAWNKVTASECWQGVRADALTFTTWPYTFMYSYEMLSLDRT